MPKHAVQIQSDWWIGIERPDEASGRPLSGTGRLQPEVAAADKQRVQVRPARFRIAEVVGASLSDVIRVVEVSERTVPGDVVPQNVRPGVYLYAVLIVVGAGVVQYGVREPVYPDTC